MLKGGSYIPPFFVVPTSDSLKNNKFAGFIKSATLMDILLGIILFFIILYYAFKLFLRYGLPWILSRFMRSQQEKFNRQYQDNAQTEGEIKINKSRSGKKKDDTGFGEYVDYEDVDEH